MPSYFPMPARLARLTEEIRSACFAVDLTVPLEEDVRRAFQRNLTSDGVVRPAFEMSSTSHAVHAMVGGVGLRRYEILGQASPVIARPGHALVAVSAPDSSLIAALWLAEEDWFLQADDPVAALVVSVETWRSQHHGDWAAFTTKEVIRTAYWYLFTGAMPLAYVDPDRTRRKLPYKVSRERVEQVLAAFEVVAPGLVAFAEQRHRDREAASILADRAAADAFALHLDAVRRQVSGVARAVLLVCETLVLEAPVQDADRVVELIAPPTMTGCAPLRLTVNGPAPRLADIS